jgi:hypothetical protein
MQRAAPGRARGASEFRPTRQPGPSARRSRFCLNATAGRGVSVSHHALPYLLPRTAAPIGRGQRASFRPDGRVAAAQSRPSRSGREHHDAGRCGGTPADLREPLYCDHVESRQALTQPLCFLILGRLVEPLRRLEIRELEQHKAFGLPIALKHRNLAAGRDEAASAGCDSVGGSISSGLIKLSLLRIQYGGLEDDVRGHSESFRDWSGGVTPQRVRRGR